MLDRFNLTGVRNEDARYLRVLSAYRHWTLGESLSYLIEFHRHMDPQFVSRMEAWWRRTELERAQLDRSRGAKQ